jgi:chemotaxis signal transduction protein
MPERDTQLDSPAALTAYLEALFREPAPAEPEPQAEEYADAEEPAESGSHALQVLLINAWGLELALPVDGVDTILKWPARLTQTPTRDSDRLGMMEHDGRSVPVFDLLRLVGAERQAADGRPATHVLLVGGGRFGLACTGPRRVMDLDPADIHPVKSAERPWHAGTLREQLCPLVDVGVVVADLTRRCAGAMA